MKKSAMPLEPRPPLKWAGGKRWQLPFIRPYWDQHNHCRLVEPFCGGLAVTLGLLPEHALINDVNPHLINFYAWLKKGLRPRISMKNDKELYYAHRKRFNELIQSNNSHSREAASLFYYLNRTGYNGLCRFNNSGTFNVPFGRYKTIPYVDNFSFYKQIFCQWEITTTDFESLQLQPTDFVYADPPYDVDFTSYSSNNFAWDDQIRAAEWLSTHPGPVILVNQSTPRIRRLYRRLGFTLQHLKLKAPRRINSTGDRTPALEVFATRNLQQ